MIIGASFDESMDDTLRVAIIATKFGDAPIKPADPTPSARSASSKPSETPGRASLSTETARPFATSPSSSFSAAKQPPAETPPPPPAPEIEPEKDPFDEILKIFGSK
ncbi:MAG: hypothetical protein LBK23_12125 [Oscillospiraceae bacterium]|nr:hypothetical protein [Oscillospiraceae bacterium]